MQLRRPALFSRNRTPEAGSRTRVRRPEARTRFELTRAATPEPPRHIPWRDWLKATAAASIVGAVAYGGAWLYLGDSLRVQQVDITGVEVVDAYAIANAADLDSNFLMTVDLAAASARIEELPGIANASVSRDWPQGVSIAVVERQGWGYWQAAGRRVMVDENGEPLSVARPPAMNAPTIIDIAAPADLVDGVDVDTDTVQLVSRLLDDRAFTALGVEPSNYVFRRDRGLTVVVDDAPDAVFGDSTNYAFKVSTWSALLDQLVDEELLVSKIDLRFGRNVVLR